MARVAGFLLVCALLSVPSFILADATTEFITVNGISIAPDAYYGRLEQVKVQVTKGDKKASVPAGDYIVEQYITEMLITQLAEKEQVAPTPEQIEAKMSFAKQTNGNIEAQLEAQGISADDWRRQLRLQQASINLLTKGVIVTDVEAKKSYDDQIIGVSCPFRVPEACHISVVTCNDKGKIDDAYKRLQSGKEFAEVAKEMSEDKTTAPYGGTVGWISSDMAPVPEIVRLIAFATELGKYSKPVFLKDKDDKAWVVIKVDKKRPEQVQSFDEVKGLLKEQLAMKKANRKAFDKLLQDFVASSKIDVSAERFKDIPVMIKKNAIIDISAAQPAMPPSSVR